MSEGGRARPPGAPGISTKSTITSTRQQEIYLSQKFVLQLRWSSEILAVLRLDVPGMASINDCTFTSQAGGIRRASARGQQSGHGFATAAMS
jgi:hypothetical protein